MANPIASDKTVLRHTLLTNLLINAANNARFTDRQQVFEIGSVYLKHGAGLPDEPGRVAILMTGAREESVWAGGDNSPVDFYDIKGVLEGLVDGLHIDTIEVTRGSHSSFHPGRSATLHIKNKVVGTFGELHPKVAQNFDLTAAPVMIAELDLDALIKAAPDLYGVEALPTAPPVLEDIALVVPQSTSAAEVEAVIRQAGGNLLREVKLFDVYTGDSIEVGHKSLAYALTYQGDETLSEKKIKKLRKKIIGSAEHRLGAKLRS